MASTINTAYLREVLDKKVPDYPVGTLDELQKHGMSARTWPCCHEPTVDGSIKGCSLWSICTMSYKGKTSGEGGGPRNHCWERVKGPAQGGGVVRNTQPCHYGISQMENQAANKGLLQVIADEGEEYETETVMADPTPTNLFNRSPKRVKMTVQPFQRIGESKQMVQARLRAEVMQREQKRVEKERAAAAFGITEGVTPADKRSGRGGKGSSKEG